MFQSEVLSVSSISSSASRDYTQLGMESLLKLKRTYINRFEYEKAKKVQEVINERKIEDINGLIQECIDKIDKKINETETDLQRKRELVIFRYKFKELDITEKIDNAFQVVKERHVEELATIEKQRALAYVRAVHKPIKESRELLAQSKRLAENDDFDGAVRIREKSRKVKEEIIQNRKEEVNQQYELMRKKIYTKQKNDIQILTGKLSAALNKNESEKIECLKSQDKLAKCAIIYYQQKILGEMSQKIKSKDKKLAMSDQINKFFNQRISQFNEKIEQAEKELLKSQPTTAQTSEVGFALSGEESSIVTGEEDEIINKSIDNFEEIQNRDNLGEESIPHDDFVDENVKYISSNENENENNNFINENEDDIQNIDNEEDIQNNDNEEDIQNNDFDEIDNNLHLNKEQDDLDKINDIINSENNNINSSNKMHHSFEEDEVFIKNSEALDSVQHYDEEEQVNSVQSQNKGINLAEQEEEEEIQIDDLIENDKSDQLMNLSGGAIELQDQEYHDSEQNISDNSMNQGEL